MRKQNKMTKQNIEYRNIVKNMNFACVCYSIISDKKGNPLDIKFIDINHKFESLMDIKAKDIIGKSLSEVITSKKKRNVNFHKLLLKTALVGKKSIIEHYIEPTNQWFRIEVSPIEKNIFVIIFVNITRRKQAEQKTLQLSEQWQLTFDAVNDGILISDNNYKVIRWNKTLEQIASKNPVQHKNYSCWEILYGLKKRCKDCLRIRAKKSLCRETKEEKIGNRYYQISIDPLFNKERKIIGAVHLLTDITERKKIENALEDSEEKYRGLINNINVGIYRFTDDIPGEIIEANPAMAKLLGYNSVDELKHSAVADLYQNPDDRKITLKRLRKNGFIKNEERFLKKKDGTPIIASASAHAKKDDMGKIVWINGALEDITERRKAENALFESEEKYRSLVQNVNIGIFRTKPKGAGRFIEVNPALVHMFGYTSDKEFMRLSPTDLYHNPNDRNVYLKRLNKYGFVSGLELQHKKKDGTIITVSMTTRVHRNEKGKIDWIDGVIEDITERKKAENALFESEEKYRGLMNNINVGIYRFSDDIPGEIIEANPAMAKLLGYKSVDELKHEAVADLYQNPDDRKLTLNKLRKFGFIKNEERYLKRKDGTPIIASATAHAQKDKLGKIVWINGALEDITERKKAENALFESEEKYRGLVQNVNIGIFRTKPKGAGRFIEVNPALVHMFGYTSDKEFMRLSPTDLYHNPNDRNVYLKRLKKYGYVSGLELQHKKKDGTIITVSMTTRVHRNEKDKIDWVDGVIEDITDRKQKEELLREQANLLELAYDAIIVRTLDSAIIYWNQGAERTYGWTKKEVLGKISHTFLKTTFPVSEKVTNQALNKHGQWEGELIHTRCDGSKIIVHSRMVLHYDSSGKPLNVLEINRDITERKQVEVSLRESEEKYRGLVNNVTIGIYRNIPDANGRFIDVNPAMVKMLGYKNQKELMGISIADLYQNLRDRDNLLKKIKQNRFVVGEELNLKKKDGTPIIIRLFARAHKNNKGKVDWIDGVMEDVTEHRQAIEALRASEERYRDITFSMSDWVWEVDNQGHYTYCHERVKDILGYSPEEILGKTPFDFMPTDEAVRISKIFSEISAKKQCIIDLENWNLRKDSTKICLLTNGVPMLDFKGNLVGYRGVDKDITERKLTEQTLRESEEKYRGLVQNVNIGIYRNTPGPQGKFIETNPAMCRIFGYASPQELKNVTVSSLYQHPQQRKIFLKQIAQNGLVKDFELKLKKKDGKLFIASVTARTHRDKNGKIDWIDGVVEDITERKQTENILRRREAILETITFASELFLKNVEWESSIQEILTRLGKAAEVSRVYIFEKYISAKQRLLLNQRYEWVNKNITSQIANPFMQNFDAVANNCKYISNIITKGDSLISHIRNLPLGEQKVLSEQDILSIAIVPIFTDQDIWGLIGFDECTKEREWSQIEIDTLKIAASVIGSAIHRKQIEQVLRKSEEKYRSLVENVNIGIYRNTPGPQGKFIETNPAMCRIFGYNSPQELKDITVCSLYQNPQQRKIFLKQIVQNGLVKDFELTLKKKDGKLFIASVTARTHRDKNGKIDWIDGVIEDIMERKQAERALRESEERYRTIFNTANDGICIISLSGKVISANQRLFDLVGLSEKDLGLRITDYNLFPPNSLALIQKNMAARFAGKEVGPYEVEMHPRKGKPTIVEVNGAIVRDSANKIIGDLIIIRDVTERKTAEQAFRESEQKFRTLVENSQDLIILRDSNDNIKYLSPACKTILGYDSEELIKKIPNIFHSLIHPDDREIVEKKLSSALDGIPCANVEYRIITKNEQVKWLSHSRTPIIENGKVTMTVGLVRDISEHKEREELLKVAKETAETANQSKTSFLHNMSHELRSPMTSIIGFTDVLIDQEQNPEKQEMLEIVKNSSRYLLKIIDNMLDLSRIEAGRIKLEKSKCNIQELAQEICKRYELLAQEKGIDFRLNINKSVPRFIIIDNTKLNQIISNLLDNAFKFTERGKIESHLALKSSPKTKQPILEIIIKDTGIGIAPDRLDKIFERFEQGEFYISKKYSGAGLGLPITKELTQLMQGTISVQSKLAQGTKFTVCIPVTIVKD